MVIVDLIRPLGDVGGGLDSRLALIDQKTVELRPYQGLSIYLRRILYNKEAV